MGGEKSDKYKRAKLPTSRGRRRSAPSGGREPHAVGDRGGIILRVMF